MSRITKQSVMRSTSLRMDVDLRDRLQALAKRERRSMSQQIVLMLERAVELEVVADELA